MINQASILGITFEDSHFAITIGQIKPRLAGEIGEAPPPHLFNYYYLLQVV